MESAAVGYYRDGGLVNGTLIIKDGKAGLFADTGDKLNPVKPKVETGVDTVKPKTSGGGRARNDAMQSDLRDLDDEWDSYARDGRYMPVSDETSLLNRRRVLVVALNDQPDDRILFYRYGPLVLDAEEGQWVHDRLAVLDPQSAADEAWAIPVDGEGMR
jgi:hypothetical protein